MSHDHPAQPASPPPPTGPSALDRRGRIGFPPHCRRHSVPCPPATHIVYPHSLIHRQPRHHRRAHTSRSPNLSTWRAHLAHRREPRATYLACADVHTSTSSVGWIAAHVVHVGQLAVCQRSERSARVHSCACGEEGWRWVVQCHSVRSCEQQRTATVITAALLHCHGRHARTYPSSGRPN